MANARIRRSTINGYVLAGYSLIWSALAWYAWRTERRVRLAERRLDGLVPPAGRMRKDE